MEDGGVTPDINACTSDDLLIVVKALILLAGGSVILDKSLVDRAEMGYILVTESGPDDNSVRFSVKEA
jgi:hypothetical protein